MACIKLLSLSKEQSLFMKDKSVLKWILSILGTKKIYVFYLALIQIFMGMFNIGYAFFFRGIIDTASNSDYESFKRYSIYLILLLLFQITLSAVNRFLTEYSHSTFENLLKRNLYVSLLSKNYAEVSQFHSGEWMNRLTSDTKVIADHSTDIVPGITGMITRMTGALISLVILVPAITVVLIPGAALLIVVTLFFRKQLKFLHKRIQESDGKLRIFLQETLENILVVHSFSKEKNMVAQSDKYMEEHKKARMIRNHFSNFSNIGFGAALQGSYILGAVYCAYCILNHTMTYGTLVAVLQLISQIQNPVANITGYVPKYYAMIASAERLMEVESFKDDIPSDSKKVHDFYDNSLETIEYQDVSFGYDKRFILEHFNLQIHKGEFIAFTGPSGCGKSTALKLLMSLYPIDEGKITINKSIELDSSWRSLFAYVPQGNEFMSGTIKDSISFYSNEIDEKRINQALEIACAKEFVDTLDDGINTVLGEKGSGLSEGQIQRLAIARAIYADNPILLLDESTSSLDEETEYQLLENIKNMTDKTVIIITHRKAALQFVDRIVEFEVKE